jgi:hypothetical protein
MNRTLITFLRVALATLLVIVSLLSLAGCVPTPTVAPVPATPTAVVGRVTPTPTPQVVASPTSSGETPEPLTPTHTLEPLLTEQVPEEIIPATTGVGNSPLPIPTQGKAESPAPDFTLDSAQGAPVTLSSYQGKLNVVLVFYLGRT